MIIINITILLLFITIILYLLCTQKQLPGIAGPENNWDKLDITGFASWLMILHANKMISTDTSDWRLNFAMEWTSTIIQQKSVKMAHL